MTRTGKLLTAAAAIALAGCASPGNLAVQHGDAAQMQQILDQPNHGGEDLGWLLSAAEQYDCGDCARVLLKMGAKPTPWALANAARNGHVHIAEILIDAGGEPAAALANIRQAQVQLRSVEWFVTPLEIQQDAAEMQSATEFFAKLEKSRAGRPAASAATAPAAVAAATTPAASEPLRSRAAPLFHAPERPDDYALIVGIEKYDDLPSATYAARDAAAAADFVQAMGVPASNVVTLTDAHATRSGIAKKLEGWLANNVDEKSTVYFYYSGHGAPDVKNGQAYLVPFDGDPEYLEQTAYSLKRLYEKLGALKARRVIVMLDSCFSGAGGRSVLAKGARPLVTNVDSGAGSADGKISVLAAAGPEQISGTYDEKGHGLFSYYLFTGLNGAAKDASGRVTLESLFAYVKPKVADDAHRANREQVPQLRGGAATDALVLRDK